MRKILMDCCGLNWGKISPVIFGSLFQSVMDEKARRNLGAHYTSEKNILKLIKPLFMDELWAEFENVKGDKRKLQKLHEKISRLRFLDPACGCGNFLIVAYRELRELEMEIIKQQLKGQTVTDISTYFTVDVDRFYGIEYEEFPAQIAQVAMWLIDHQMNMKASETFGEYYVRLPLRKSATIVHGNALRIDWQSLIEPMPWEKEEARFDYILGNPPFVGKHLQNAEQKEDMDRVFAGLNGAGVLDYVTAWYIRAAQYLKATSNVFKIGMVESYTSHTRCAFVSTNSIAQGEQVGVLWNELFNKYHIKIFFAHRTFKWGNEARGNAAVHVVIIGFVNFNIHQKSIYEYEDVRGEPHEVKVKNINPYLVEGQDFAIVTRKKTLNQVPEMYKGSQPTDGGNLLMDDEEKNNFVAQEPQAEKFIRRFVSAREFLNNEKRWCFWLVDADPAELKQCPKLIDRINAVKQFRLKSTKAATVKWAQMPGLFTENRQPNSDYILIPRHSSENRKYIPFGFFTEDHVVADSCNSIPNATKYHFGVLESLMHNIWVKYVCGRIKSDYRYSNDIVYNNFPWPQSPTEKQVAAVEEAAQAVLDARASFPNSSLADLYDPNTMPPVLVKAHQQLDKAVDLCYRPQPFPNETRRIEFLFELYAQYTAGLFAQEKKMKKKKARD